MIVENCATSALKADPNVWSGRALQEGRELGWWCCGLASMYQASNVERFHPLRATMDMRAHSISLAVMSLDTSGHQVSNAP